MVEQVYFKDQTVKKHYKIKFVNTSDYESLITLKTERTELINSISFEINFKKKIIAYRSHDYKWTTINIKKSNILNEHSAKIIVFEDYTYMMSSKNVGAWQINSTKQLTWVLKKEELHPLFQYEKNNIRRFNKEFITQDYNLKLLFPKESVIEFSRSKIPFKTIVCFTDHCDFDTNKNLENQLSFFNKHNIKTSKGFFLNHFSKRRDNSSYENDKQILLKFNTNKHELVYHSITQSLREKNKAINEFNSFIPPLEFPVETYIDHGYQPYNFTLSKKLMGKEWSKNINNKNIKNIWTYLDSGTSGNAIINQLNSNHFTPNRLLKYNFFNPIFLFRTIIFFSGNEDLLIKYRQSARLFKEILYNKNLKKVPLFFSKSFSCFKYVFSTFVNRETRNNSFKYSKFTPFIFQHEIDGKVFNFFQTVEVTNFEKTFTKANLDLLIKEKGAIIAHCYFSSPLKHQKGKLFKNNKITQKNDTNFAYLSKKIKNKDIWNPTISELIKHSIKTSEIEFFIDKGKIKVKSEIPVREIKYV